MNKIYLISAEYVRQNSEVNSDVEDKYMFRSILSSQEIELQGLLGTQLYELIIDAAYAYAVSGTSMETRLYTLLENYLIPTLLYSVLKDVIPFIYFKITPKTIGQQDGQYMKPSDYDLVTLLKKEYDDKYQHYIARTLNYINEYADTYPEYGVTRTDGTAQNMTPQPGTYFGGLQL